ncbi:MAG: hypothetical protein ACR5KV_05075 [Wolbachia sp.]
MREAISQIMDRNSFTQTKFMDCRKLILQQEAQNLNIVDNFQLMSFIVEMEYPQTKIQSELE